MKIFEISDKIKAVCEFKKTKNGFKHEATLFINGVERDKAKVCYLNRTWERYEFESVLLKLIEKSKSLTEEDKKICFAFIKEDKTDYSMFKTTAMVAKIGEIICKDKKEQNDWKTRMLKAGLNLEMPEDWDKLDEKTKQERLNRVIAEALKTGVKQ